MWSIVPQEVKKGFVLVKEIKFFPITDKKTKEISFGRLTEENICQRLYYRHAKAPADKWMITLGKHGFNITCPTRQVPASKVPTDTTMKTVPGRAFGGNPTSGCMTERKLLQELTQQCGVDFANTVINLFLQPTQKAA